MKIYNQRNIYWVIFLLMFSRLVIAAGDDVVGIVNPNEDFFAYVNGGLPQPNCGALRENKVMLKNRVYMCLNFIVKDRNPENKIAMLYTSLTNKDAKDLMRQEIRDEFDSIDRIKTIDGLIGILGDFSKIDIRALVSLKIIPDSYNKNMITAFIAPV